MEAMSGLADLPDLDFAADDFIGALDFPETDFEGLLDIFDDVVLLMLFGVFDLLIL